MADVPEKTASHDDTMTNAPALIQQSPSNEALMTGQEETEAPVTVEETKDDQSPVQDTAPKGDEDLLTGCRVAIKLLDASDVPSSARSVSDPDSFLSATAWLGGQHEVVNNDDKNRIQQASCSSNMEGPRFDTELIFPLSVESIDDILSGQVAVTLTDGGDGDGDDEGGES